MALELLVVCNRQRLRDALGQLGELALIVAPTLPRAARMIASDVPPQAVYLESIGTIDELWAAIAAAQTRALPVFVGLTGAALMHATELRDAGVAVTETTDETAVVAWIAQQLGLARRTNHSQAILVVSGAKGGVSKSTTTAMLAEGFVRRGAHVLVVDGDLSNSGLRPPFHIDATAASYVQIKQDKEPWTVDNVRRCIVNHPSGIHFLLGAEQLPAHLDLQLLEWEALIDAVRQLAYDLVIVDTGPDMRRRPYAPSLAMQHQALVILPTMSEKKERFGTWNALKHLSALGLLRQCRLLYVEPEPGGMPLDVIQRTFATYFKDVPALGTVPRARRLLTAADEASRYVSPFQIAPHSSYVRTFVQIVDALAHELQITLPKPLPRSTFWQRLRGDQITLPQLEAIGEASEVQP